MFGEISNSKDFEKLMQCVAQDEDRKNEQFVVVKKTHVSKKIQLDVGSSTQENVVFEVLINGKKNGLKSRQN